MEERKKITEMKTILISVSTALFFLCALFVAPLRVDAATVSFSPASGSYAIGQTFSVGVYVGSADQAMNAASGVVSFSEDTLEVVSISKSGSIFNLWVQDPSFSNSAGSANFEGIVYNPGFTGTVGKILAITFRAKAEGAAFVSFSSAAILANDGSGTNILEGMGRANFTITGGAAPVEEKPEEPKSLLPGAVRVTSATHPDSEKWFSHNDPVFEWSLGSGVSGVSFSVTQDPHTDPGTITGGKMTSKTYTDLADGIWYFHIRAQNAEGWGPVTHFRFNIDTQKPTDFTLKEITTTSTYQTGQFIFTAADTLSGIDRYEVQIDSMDIHTWIDDGTHTYTTSILSPGGHVLNARVFDKAGNYIESSISFEIFPGTALPVSGEGEAVRAPMPLLFLIGIGVFFFLFCVFLILLILYFWYKYRYVKEHFNDSPGLSAADVEEALHKTFAILRGKVEEYSLLVKKTRLKKKIDDNELLDEEARILSDFKKYLDSAEKIMKKHIKK